MKCVQSWSLIWKKRWYTWIVGHFVNQKNKSKNNQVFKCYLAKKLNVLLWNMTTDKPGVLDCGCNWLCRIFQLLPNYNLYRYCGFYFHFLCVCVIYRCLSMCKNNPYVSFRAVCSILVLQHFKWSSTHKGGGTLESGTQRHSAHYGKEVHRNSVHFLAEYNSFSMKRWNSWVVGRLGNYHVFLHLLRQTISKL